MKTRLRALIGVVLLLCLFQTTEAEQVNKPGKQFVAEPDVQKQLSQTVSVLLNHWKKKASEEDVVKAIEELKSTRSNVADLFPQLILYQVDIMADEKKYHAMIIIWGNLFPNVSESDTVEVMVPYLETANPTVYGEIKGILDSLPSRQGDIEGDSYQSFEPYLTARKDNPPEALIKYMYNGLPDEAFKSLIHSLMEDGKEKVDLIKSAEKIRIDAQTRLHKSEISRPPVNANVVSALSDLSQSNKWWVHLYVAEKMRKNPKLRSSTVLDQLKKSKHHLVLKTIREIEKK